MLVVSPGGVQGDGPALSLTGELNTPRMEYFTHCSQSILSVPATMVGPEQAVEWNRLAMENHKSVLDYVKLLYFFFFCFVFKGVGEMATYVLLIFCFYFLLYFICFKWKLFYFKKNDFKYYVIILS